MAETQRDRHGSDRPAGYAPHPIRRRKTAPGAQRSAAAYLARTFGPGELDASRRPGLAVLSGAVAALAMILRLLLPRPVGMADQGTGHQLLCSLGVRNIRPWSDAELGQYIHPGWVPQQYYGEACGFAGSGEPVYSSELLLLWLGKWLTPLWGWGPGLDTRAVGIVCCIVFGALVAGLVAVLPGRAPFRVLIAALVTLVTADGIFADFFVSPHSEAAAFLGTLALAVALLHYWNGRKPQWIRLLLVVLAAGFALTAKPQMVAWLPVVALAVLWQPRRGRARRRWTSFAAPAAAVAAVAVVAVAFLAVQPKRAIEENLYNTVFVGILSNSPDPAADLEWLGLDRSFLPAVGSTMESTNSAVHNPRYPHFRERINQARIAGFYATHPERLISLGEQGTKALLTPELGNAGSYMADSGQAPGAKERRIPLVLALYTGMKAAPVVLVGLHLLTLLLGFAVSARRKSGIGRLAVVMVLACWTQFWLVMIMERQPDIHSQLIVAGFTSALCLPLVVALVCILASTSRRHPRPQAG